MINIDKIIITNNKTVDFKGFQIVFIEGTHREVLDETLKRLQKGGRLLTSPNPPSIKMFHSPVRSILIREGDFDEESVMIMENSIAQYDRVMNLHDVDYRNSANFEMMDKSILESGIEELKRFERKGD